MNGEAIKAVQTLTANIEILKKLYPEMESIGTPAYMCNGTRLHFSMKLINGKRKSVQYARLLLECSIGRRLIGNETVDHIDGNVANNEIYNLQVLSKSDNCRKGSNDINRRKVAEINSIRMKGNKIAIGNDNGMAKLSDIQLSEIRIFQRDHYRGQDKILADQYGVSRELISKIRRGKVRINARVLER